MVFPDFALQIGCVGRFRRNIFLREYENGDNFSSFLAVQRDTSPSMSKLRDGNVQRKMLTAGIHCQKMHSTI